jgi:hypothetical protein
MKHGQPASIATRFGWVLAATGLVAVTWVSPAAAPPLSLHVVPADITIDPMTGVGARFDVVDAGGLDIEACAFLEPGADGI